MSGKELRGGKAFAFPLAAIVLLLICYWIMADWPAMPALINSALTAMHWRI